MVAGLASAGADALRVGVLPTPAVAHLVDALGADLGVMISASHNAMPDNGIKLFAAGGHKLPDAVEVAVEQGVGASFTRPTGAAIGRVRDLPDAGSRYVAHLLASTPQPLAGLRVVVDCAYGAASAVAPDCYAPRRRGGRRAARRPGRAQHQRRGGLDPPRPAAGGRPSARRRPRHRARRRRRPLPGRRRGRPRRRRRPDHGGAGPRDARGGRARRRHAGRHRDEQPRPAPGDARARHHAADHPGRRPVRPGGAARRRILARRRAVRARRPARVRHHRRRAADGAAR